MSALMVWLSWSMVVAFGLLAAWRGVPSRLAIATGLDPARPCGAWLPAIRSPVVPRTRSPGQGYARDPDKRSSRPHFSEVGGRSASG
jgi:hypothetical protein